MATSAPTLNPQGPPDTPGGPTAVSPGDQQANPLQTDLADITRRVLLLAHQNPTIEPPLQAVFNMLRVILKKVMMTPQQPAPPQGPQQM